MLITTLWVSPELAEKAKERTPEWAEEITGISADDIRKFARGICSTQPSAIRIGVALEKSWGGSQAIRAVASLPALNWSLASCWRRYPTISCLGTSL